MIPLPPTHQATLDASAEALALAARLPGDICVVHGAGSFGHFQAREYGVSKGTAHPSFSWIGFALTRQSVGRLNEVCSLTLYLHTAKIHCEHGVNSLSISTTTVTRFLNLRNHEHDNDFSLLEHLMASFDQIPSCWPVMA